ncbi:O-linked-mannose beta-1-2-N-acetylglucosaminyltransferase 1-like [Brachionus plicatilis]|uniref:O-linked-mannose beta-1-2-N-acetylglucosaminyltransferase 1-like n=1 Tax=Brachionus plicatilis TaxID=10195 RepID=A0A3M7R6Z0_BRAPC|nr:O-linked-mannose beta-1-2-N-acetylglucosaminyltransferase 1-like [Brachionus plicatilis]
MPNIKRLIIKRFGGTANFLIFVLFLFVLYLTAKNYFTESSHSQELISNRIDSGIKNSEHVKTEAENKLKNENQEKKPKYLPNHGKPDPECEIEEKCTAQSVAYKLVSGQGMDKYPVICLNGKLLLSKNLPDNKIGRGINLIVIDQNNLEVKSMDAYDTYTDDTNFYRYITKNTKDGDIVMIASFDEMANALRETSIKAMESYGSQLFGNIKFRDGFVMIGQRGVVKGKAIEYIEPKGKKDFAAQAKITGCANFPLGTLSAVKFMEKNVIDQDQILVGNYLKNCGLRDDCKAEEFAVHVYTGKNDRDEPRICVDGRYVIARGINDAGRGINIVVVGNGKEVLKTAHFDTYVEDSTNLEIFLEGLNDNVVIIAVTFDEASTNLKHLSKLLFKDLGSQFIDKFSFRSGWLGNLARNLFFDLGSGLIQNLKHRDAWIFVGRKGIDGFSPIEEISYASADKSFPPVLDKKFCVPQTLKGMRIRPDPLPNQNDRRRDFCSRYDGYGDFCMNENVDKPLNPAPLINKTLENHAVFKTPIFIISSMSHTSLRMTLETIIMQPGVQRSQIFVCIDEKLDELWSLVDLFGFRYCKIESSYNYTEIYRKALVQAFETDLTDSNENVIIIEEDLILSPDFLYFFTQLYDTFTKDPNIAAISTWNPNGFTQLDGSSSFVYRTNEFPGLAYMLKKSVYDVYIKDSFYDCCSNRAWYNWNLIDKKTKQSVVMDVLVPDVSRSFRRPYDISSDDYSFLNNLINRKRRTNLIPFPELVELSSLVSRDSYDNFLKKTLKSAIEFPNYQNCFKMGNVSLPQTTNQYYKIIYVQENESDLEKLKELCNCFHLFFDQEKAPKGLYQNNVLRFHARKNNYIFVGSKSKLLL